MSSISYCSEESVSHDFLAYLSEGLDHELGVFHSSLVDNVSRYDTLQVVLDDPANFATSTILVIFKHQSKDRLLKSDELVWLFWNSGVLNTLMVNSESVFIWEISLDFHLNKGISG